MTKKPDKETGTRLVLTQEESEEIDELHKNMLKVDIDELMERLEALSDKIMGVNHECCELFKAFRSVRRSMLERLKSKIND
jgi:cob(I)alamin adenosyltransferase